MLLNEQEIGQLRIINEDITILYVHIYKSMGMEREKSLFISSELNSVVCW